MDHQATIREEIRYVKPHDHICLIYETQEEWLATIISFLVIGLEQKEKCIYMADAHTPEEVRKHLHAAGVDIAACEGMGQLVIRPEAETPARNGCLDPDRMIALLIAETEKAVAAGYPLLRITCEMGRVARELSDPVKLLEYEAKLNRDFFPNYPCIAICQYDHRKFDSRLISGLVMNHPILVRDNCVYHNFCYIPPEVFLGGRYAERVLARSFNDARYQSENLERVRLLADVLENSSQAFYAGHPDGRVMAWNRSFSELTGYSNEELQLIKWNMDLTAPEWNAREAHIIEELRFTGKPQRYKCEYCRKDGVRVPVEVFAHVVHDDEGKVIYYYSFVIDMTEPKKTEKLLRESELRFRTLIENATDLIMLLNAEGEIVYLSPSAERIIGFKPEDLTGARIFDSFHPDDYKDASTSFANAVKIPGPATRALFRLRHRDGSFRYLEGIYNNLLDDPIINAVVVNARDVTDARLTEGELKQSSERLRKATEGTIETLARLIEARDPYTSGHQRRVAGLAGAIAKEMGLSEAQIEGIRFAALIHDVGKTVIPSGILNKPAPLSDIEFSLVKTHPKIGYDILRSIDFPWPVAEIVLQHHERLNGSGYPGGLSGCKIILEARILGVADVVEAMASHRPYRPAHGLNKAMEEIASHRGILYDVGVVDACIEVITRKGFTFDK